MNETFHAQHTFSLSITVTKIMKQKRANALELLRNAYISALLFGVPCANVLAFYEGVTFLWSEVI